MSDSTIAPIAPLVPNAGAWMDADLNVMLVGLHGVGKTQVILDTAKERGIKVKYFSCSTLDPFTDLVGVPFLDPNDAKHTIMARPRDIDEAELIFFDEFNRADPKVHNAVLEIVQFGTINGEPLPKLRMVWAAMNPPNKEYDVEDLDPALIDRFDCYEEVTPRPSAEYLATRGMSANVAKALCQWHRQMNKRDVSEMITPRRLEKIGQVYTKTGDASRAIPMWFEVDRNKLYDMLREATALDSANKVDVEGGTANSGPYRKFEYSPKYLRQHEAEVSEYIRDHQDDLMTQKAIATALKDANGSSLAGPYAAILSALTPSIREAFLTQMTHGRFTRFKDDLSKVPDTRLPLVRDLIETVDAEHTRRQEEG